MKMISRRNKKIEKRFFLVLIILAMFLVVIAFFGFKGALSGPAISLASPVFMARDFFGDWYKSQGYFLKTKKNLEDENFGLKEKLAEKEAELLSLNIVKNENNELKNLLGRKIREKRRIATSVLMRPPQTPYDILIIDVGEEDGVGRDMLVAADGDILLGFVEEVFKNTARIKLYSRAEEEINVFIDKANIFTVAKGSGGGNFEITLPRVNDVKVGSVVTTPGADPFILGIVEFVKADMADAFQRVLFRTPLNIQELKWVEVYPDLTNAIFSQIQGENIDKNN